jgi:hypothetical protein
MDKRRVLFELIRFLQTQSVKADEITEDILFPTGISKALYQKTLLNAELALGMCRGFLEIVPDDQVEAMFIVMKQLNLTDFNQFLEEGTNL